MVRAELAKRLPIAASGPGLANSKGFTVTEAAGILRVQPRTVRTYIKFGELRATRNGPNEKRGPYVITAEDLDAYRRAHRVDPEGQDIDEQAGDIVAGLGWKGG